MPENRPLRVFLCHSSNDKPTVRELYRQLSAEGWMDVWLDEEKLYPGQDWNLEIEKAVEAADAILVCLSNNSITKEGYVQRELRIVLDYADYKPEGTLYLIPIRLEQCDPPRRLRPWQYADYFEKDRDRAYQRLLVSLRMRASALSISTEESKVKPFSERPKPETRHETVEIPKAKPPRDQEKAKAESGAFEPASKYEPVVHAIYTFGSIEFVMVPSGRFLMGSTENDIDYIDDETPQHSVELPYNYYLARFPITNKQYAAYTEAKSLHHPVKNWEQKQDHPVANVSWNHAMAYSKWLNDLLRGVLPDGLVLRLPTEAEWEKAARGEKGLIYPWGDTFDNTKCNTYGARKGGTTSVQAYSPQGDSPYGCVDMSGNVYEWTHSLYEPYPYNPNDGREDGKAHGDRVLRGACFGSTGREARCASRDRNLITSRSVYRGFRVGISRALP